MNVLSYPWATVQLLMNQLKRGKTPGRAALRGAKKILPLIALCATSRGSSSPTMEQVFASLASSKMALDTLGPQNVSVDDPWTLKLLRTESLKFSLTSEQLRSPKDPCDQEFVQKSEAEARRWKNFPRDCLSTPPLTVWRRWTQTYQSLMIRSQFRANPFYRHVVFELPGGVKLKGLLALHDDQPRPLVVFRGGLFANSEEFFGERFLALSLFEQTPLNMLLLESTTGVEFLRRNSQLRWGGWEEGVQNLQVLKLLRDPREPLHRLVTEIHLLGISLGGLGLRLTHELQSLQGGAPWIQSTTLLCPTLDLEATLKSHTRNPVKRKIVNAWAESRLHSVKAQWGADGGGEHFLEELIKKVVKEYQGPAGLESWMQIPADADVKDFWASHEFIAKLPGELMDPSFGSKSSTASEAKVPLTLIATKEDPLVPLSLNSGRFQETEVLDRGIHCGLSSVYDWSRLSTYLEGAFFCGCRGLGNRSL